MGTYKDNVLTAWSQVNAAAASPTLAGAAPAFRHAIAQTDFASLVPSWDFGPFKLYVLDWLEGNMVYVDTAADLAVASRHLWQVLTCDYDVLDVFVDDLIRGASGVKVIDYDNGPYKEAGKAWRRVNHAVEVAADPLSELEARLQGVLTRAQAIATSGGEQTGEQFQALFTELSGAGERHAELQAQLARLGDMLDLAREAVAEI